jgi:hypothetical protein
MKVCDHVGKSRDHQLARAFDATGSSDAWVFGQHSNKPNNFKYSFNRRTRVGTAYILLDRIEVAASAARPL